MARFVRGNLPDAVETIAITMLAGLVLDERLVLCVDVGFVWLLLSR